MAFEIGQQVVAARDAKGINHEPAEVVGADPYLMPDGIVISPTKVGFPDGEEASYAEGSPALKSALEDDE